MTAYVVTGFFIEPNRVVDDNGLNSAAVVDLTLLQVLPPPDVGGDATELQLQGLPASEVNDVRQVWKERLLAGVQKRFLLSPAAARRMGEMLLRSAGVAESLEDAGRQSDPLVLRGASVGAVTAHVEAPSGPVRLLALDLRTVAGVEAHLPDSPISERTVLMEPRDAVRIARAILTAASGELA